VRRAASRTNDEGASSGPRSRTRRFTPADFSFAFVGRGERLMLLLRFKAMLFSRAGKSGRPPPLEPSLKVQRDIAHSQISGFAVAPGIKDLNARRPLKVHPIWRLAAPASQAAAGIVRPKIAGESRAHQRPSQSWRRRGCTLDHCESDQARTEQDKAGDGHSQETVRSEFFAHGTPPFASPLKQNGGIRGRETRRKLGGRHCGRRSWGPGCPASRTEQWQCCRRKRPSGTCGSRSTYRGRFGRALSSA
jgi:hypothetical protein